jgi:hypothetical protein
MRWIVPVLWLALGLAACGGRQIPQHAGYKSEKSKPWKKAKNLAFDDDWEAKDDGDLSYPDRDRAEWYELDLPSHGELTVKVEIEPPDEATNDAFDLALEILDPGFRVIGKSDLEDEDAYELTKTKTLFDLEPGRYYVHLYLQSRLDYADYQLRVEFKPSGGGGTYKSDFPAQVAFLPTLHMVPLDDDTPKGYRAPRTVTTKVIRKRPRRRPKPETTEAPPPPTTVSARIIGIAVVPGGTQVTLGRGTASTPPAVDGMKAKISGVPGVVAIERCNERTCKAVVKATPDQITKGGSKVVLSP